MSDIVTGLLPRHVGIIMDGNGRWAKSRGFSRSKGHEEGLSSAKRVVKRAKERGVPFLSLYTFSTENWKRAEDEVGFLMFLIKNHLRKELDFYRENSVRIVHSGDSSRLPPDVMEELASVIEDTASHSALTLNLAVNYGGRDEIVRSVNRLLAKRPERITESDIASSLDVPSLPDPDLIIRTGGDTRLSNFLLWQSAYAELIFSGKLWPDFETTDFDEAIESFMAKERRFGNAK